MGERAGHADFGGRREQDGSTGAERLEPGVEPENPGSEAGEGAPQPVDFEPDADAPLRDGHNPEPGIPPGS